MRKIFLTYRQNELFDKYVPQILDGLSIVGTFIIPAGTEVLDVKDEYSQKLSTLSECGVTHIIHDDTCSPWDFLSDSSLHEYRNKIVRLDRLFSSQIYKWIGRQTVADNLKWFASCVANGKPVKKVVVVKKSINDHDCAGEEDISHPRGMQGFVAEKVGEVFKAESVMVDTLKEALEFAHEVEAMIVADRHSGIKEVMPRSGKWYDSLSNWPHQCMLFILPFETCAKQLIDRGTFPYSFNVDEMRDEVLMQLV